MPGRSLPREPAAGPLPHRPGRARPRRGPASAAAPAGRRRPGRISARLLGLLLAAAPAVTSALGIHAGHVQGRISDENGKPLAGALVTISGPEAVGIWTCPTDGRGFYRIPGLPAGRELTLRVEAPDRAVLERRGYRVRNDQTLHLNFRLRPKGVYYTLIVTDPRVPYHKTALGGARSSLPPGVRVFEVTEVTPAVSRKLRRVLAGRPDGVLAIGSLSARIARESIFDTPVVYTLVLDPVKENLEADNLCGIPANGAFSEQLDVLARMAPSVKRLGTIFDPARMDGVVRQLRSEAEGAGYTLEARSFHDAAAVPERLASLQAAGIEAFVVLLDPGLITARVFNEIRAFSQERGIILIAPDSAMVRSGATFSYAPGFHELGAYAGRLLTNVMQRKVTVPEIGIIFPRTRYLSVNPGDAERYGLHIPPDLYAPAVPPAEGPRILIEPDE